MADRKEQKNENPGYLFFDHLRKAAEETMKPAFSVIRMLLLIMLPVSFAVLALEVSGVLYYISVFMDPLMRFLGLPGEAALAIISSVFISIYSAIAVIKTLTLTGKQVIILASMCLIAHDFFVECLVMKKTGSLVSKIVLLRVSFALFAAWALYHVVPEFTGRPITALNAVVYKSGIGIDLEHFRSLVLPWFKSSMVLVFQVFVIVFLVIFVQHLLDRFGIIKLMGRFASPLIRFFGLPANTAYMWLIAAAVGVNYGSGVLISEVRAGRFSRLDADLFNHHAALNHSQIEDTLLFVSIGVPYLWAALPRVILAFIAVWLEKFRRIIFRRSFRVKVV